MIGHSQFEKIPLSDERQKMYLQKQIDDVVAQTAALKAQRAENFTIKQMERMKKQLQRKLDKLNDQSRKDDVITFMAMWNGRPCCIVWTGRRFTALRTASSAVP